MAQTKSIDRLEVEIITNSTTDSWFTIAGSIRHDIDKLRKDVTLIHNLVLTHKGQTVAQVKDVWLKKSKEESEETTVWYIKVDEMEKEKPY